MYKVVPVVHIEKHTELELLIHYKLYCDVFPYFTLLRALSGLIRLLPIEKFIPYRYLWFCLYLLGVLDVRTLSHLSVMDFFDSGLSRIF